MNKTNSKNDTMQNKSSTSGPKLLLINPRFPESFWSFRWAVDRILPDKRAINPPLGLATLAALCPDHWEVLICDENVESLPLTPDADLIGVCGMAVQHPRQREILQYYRNHGYYVVAGGSYASLCPEHFDGLVETTVAGEAEYIWPSFCRDYEAGTAKSRYQEQGIVALEDSPTPRFDLIKLERYTTASLQFSRGCPYQCEFCDIIVMFGRRPRTKAPDQIGRELDALRAQNVRNVFFVDDNLIGHRPKAKALLQFLHDYQRRHDYYFEFGTEASLNLAEDPEMLELFQRAGFGWVFLGIETPDPNSLREAKKSQNLRGDLLAGVRTLYTYGIDVLGGFIIGFDNDTQQTFDVQHRFITKAGIQIAMVGLLTALPKTPLYARLEREGRLREGAQHGDNTKAQTNVIPKGMTYTEMTTRYKALYRRLVTDHAISRRIANKTRYFGRPVRGSGYSVGEGLGILSRLIRLGILPGGASRLRYFVASLARTRVRLWPLVVTEWIRALAMADYIKRHFAEADSTTRQRAGRALNSLRRRYQSLIQRGALEAELDSDAARLRLTLRGITDPAELRPVARQLRWLLRNSAATVTLHIESLYAGQRTAIETLLKRLSPYGDRIYVRVHDRLREVIDSSVFHLSLCDERAESS